MGAAKTTGPGPDDSLLIFYDDFVEFQESCAFLCDAIASMVGEEDRFDPCTASGIKEFCHSVKDRSQQLRRELKKIQEGP